jgi:PPK2 family polyphosphate:nucleotide phosphotransferase
MKKSRDRDGWGPMNMKLSDPFRVDPHSEVKLRDIDPGFHGKHADRKAARDATDENLRRMGELQYLLYADHRRSVLVCLQGLDAAGKDGTIAHVFSAMNPEGVTVSTFKVPTAVEHAHDFLWRVHRRTPAQGELTIFNRSHYEAVLIERVQGLVPASIWSSRYDRINEFENNLVDGGTIVLKFYLHISENEQLERFAKRLDDPTRRWKISEADYADRKLWPAYIDAYEDVFRKTSTKHAPWFIIPANHKWFRNLAVSTIIVQAMESLALELPKPSVDIDEIRKKYHSAKKNKRGTGKQTRKKT